MPTRRCFAVNGEWKKRTRRVQEVFQWTTTPEYEALNFTREALTIDPAKACQPLGAVLCSLGFANTLPYVHGSRGLRGVFPHLF